MQPVTGRSPACGIHLDSDRRLQATADHAGVDSPSSYTAGRASACISLSQATARRPPDHTGQVAPMGHALLAPVDWLR